VARNRRRARRLIVHDSRGGPTRWGAVASGVSVLVIVSGAAFALSLAGPDAKDFLEGPTGVGLMFVAGLFLLGAFSMIVKGVREVRAAARQRPASGGAAEGPWLADHPWDPAGTQDDGPRVAVACLVFGTVVVAGVAVTGGAALAAEHVDRGLIMPLGAFAVAGVVALGYGAYRLSRFLKFGRSRLRFATFPFFLGEKLKVWLSNGRGIGRFGSIRFTLRCLEEEVLHNSMGSEGGSSNTVFAELHADSFSVREPGTHEAGSPELPIAFDLPPDAALATSLSSSPKRYWELMVQAKTRGLDYKTTFLLPVYSRPGREGDAGGGE